MFVDLLIEYMGPSKLCSLLSVDRLLLFEDIVQFLLNMRL